MSLNFVFIGAGNLATQLSQAIVNKGNLILQVYSRTEFSAKELAGKLNTTFTTLPDEINPDADIYFVALKDSAIVEVLSHVNFQNKLVVHCSGSLPLSALESYSSNIGVFYPLQTFSKQREVDFGEIPVFIEANLKNSEEILFQIGRQISNSVTLLNSEKRKFLHIAAVFACNFVNHFYSISAEILKDKEIPFDVLKPLIQETAAKVMEMEPAKAQTGPAVRFDENIILGHMEELKGNRDFAELYNSISKSIFEFHQQSE
jgi:predicted short-subunit dehydrogenase-like oxidoreductase (DUF2520 family)